MKTEPVDNFDRIEDLLNFRTDDDFYFLQIIQRKKDRKKGKVNGTNNNSRLIKSYQVRSKEYYRFIEPEVKELCNVFHARAGIDLNRRSYEAIALRTLQKVTDQIINKDFNKVHKAYDSVCGNHSHEDKASKRWILDVDDIGRASNDIVLFAERECRPIGAKYVATIPSKNGYHIIMTPFDLKKFSEYYPDIEVHKNNPTNLYIPV